MERLTGRDKRGVYYRHGKESGIHPYADRPPHDCIEAIERLVAYEDTGETPESIKNLLNTTREQSSNIIKMGLHLEKIENELAAYKDAEEQGLLIKLPCKVGDAVYHVHEGEVKDYTISSVMGIDLRVTTKHNYYPCLCQFNSETIGKTVFLTKEEAEEALKKQ